MKLAIGCPVSHRAWILDHWFDHIEKACEAAGVDPYYVFVGDPADRSMAVIERRSSAHIVVGTPNTRGEDVRDWGPERLRRMVALRNTLLGAVRMLRPEYFLSIDSDILAHPYVVRDLIADIELDGWDAVGGKCYMSTTSTNYPSWARLGREGALMRWDSNGYFAVEIIMAIKMMTPDAYNIDYVYHQQGEDVGWSRACHEAGLRLAWDGRIASKHVLDPHLLGLRDHRVGF